MSMTIKTKAESFTIKYPDEPATVHGDLITPIKKRSKTPLSDSELLEKITELENTIKEEPLENILAVDECGNVFMHCIGDIDSVNMDTRFWNAAKAITHNHPNGSALSGMDISHLCDTECQEIRACNKDIWHSVKRGENWINLDAERVKNEVNNLLRIVEIEAIKYAGALNDIDIGHSEKDKKLTPIRPENMSETEFEPIRKQTITDAVVLYRIYSARILRKYAEEHNIVYNVGELNAETALTKIQLSKKLKEAEAIKPEEPKNTEDTKGCILSPLYKWVDENKNIIPTPEIDTVKLMRKYCPEVFRDYTQQ